MTKRRQAGNRRNDNRLGGLAAAALFALPLAGHAQVISDGSTVTSAGTNWTNGTIAPTDGTVNATQTTAVHSFSKFDLTSGQSITFSGASSYRAIIARITDTNPSSIDGTVNVTAPNADFFLINPQGFVFGSNAVINVPAALYISTADSVKFSDASSIPMTATPIGTLSTANYASFGFLGGNSSNITINGTISNLQRRVDIESHGDLILGTNAKIDVSSSSSTGGSIDISNTGNTTIGAGASLRANGFFSQGGRISINSASLSLADDATFEVKGTAAGAEGGVVGINTTGNISLSGAAGHGPQILARANSGGIIQMKAGGQISLNNARLDDAAFGSLGIGGLVEITAGQIVTTGASTIDASNFSNDGAAINLKTTAGGLDLSNLSINASSQFGNGGSITFDVGGVLTIPSTASVNASSTDASSFLPGNGGTITVLHSTGIDMQANAGLNVSAAADDGVGGTITLNSTGALNIGSQVSLSAISGGGHGGTITTNTASFSMAHGAVIAAGTNDPNGDDGGSVSITTTGNASLTGTAAVSDAATISADSFYSALGNGGSVALNVGGVLTMDYGNLESSVGFGVASASATPGHAGTVSVSANSLNATNSTFNVIGSSYGQDGGTLNISTVGAANIGNSSLYGAGPASNGGNATFTVGGLLGLDNTNVFFGGAYGTNNGPRTSGHGGSITVQAGSLNVTNNSSFNQGVQAANWDAGPVSITTSGNATFTNSTAAINEDSDQGNGGATTMSVGGTLSLDNSVFLTDAPNSSTGHHAGSFSITAGNVSLINSSKITGFGGANGSTGGNISIQTGTITTTGSTFGFQGNSANAGSFTLTTTGDATFNGAAPSQQTFLGTSQTGNGGAVTLNVGGNLSFNSTAAVQLSVLGAAATTTAGTATITANSLTTAGGNTFNVAGGPGTGNAGTVNITTVGNMTLDGAGATANAVTVSGNAGHIQLQAGGQVTLSNGAGLQIGSGGTTVGGTNGTIDINAASFNMSGAATGIAIGSGSNLRGGGTFSLTTTGNASFANSIGINGNAGGNGGNVNLNIGGLLGITNSTIQVSAGRATPISATGGTINIHANTLNMSGTALLRSEGTSAGTTGGLIDITTTGNATFTGTAGSETVATRSALSPTGNGGTINLHTGGVLTLTNAAFDVSAGYAAPTGTPTTAKAGNININAGSLLTSNSLIEAGTGTGQQSGGNISITTVGNASFTGIGAVTTLDSGAVADTVGGTLKTATANSTAGNITLNIGGVLSTSNTRFDAVGNYDNNATVSGNGGVITISAASVSAINNSEFFFYDNYGPPGNGGSLSVTTTGDATFGDAANYNGLLFQGGGSNYAGSLALNVGGNLTLLNTETNLDVSAIGGNISMKAGGTLRFDNSALWFDTGGSAAFTANRIDIVKGSLIGSDAPTVGGDIVLQAKTINIGTETAASPTDLDDIYTGPNGNILIRAGSLTLGPTAVIVADASSAGYTGGDLALSPHSVLTAGRIGLYANSLNILPGAVIVSSAPQGLAGDITLAATDFTMSGGTISTQGQSGGAIRLAVDKSLTASAGTIQTNVATSSNGTDGNIYVGIAATDPTIANAACDAACQSFTAYSTPWTPGSQNGVPSTSALTITPTVSGAAGRMIVGQSSQAAPDKVTVNVAPAPSNPVVAVQTDDSTGGSATSSGTETAAATQSSSDDHSSSGKSSSSTVQEKPGVTYVSVRFDSPVSICSASAVTARHRNSLSQMLVLIPKASPGTLAPQTYMSGAQKLSNKTMALACADDNRDSRWSSLRTLGK